MPTPVALTSTQAHWHYLTSKPDAPKSMDVLNRMLDLPTPLSPTDDNCVLIGRIVAAVSLLAAAH